MSSDTWCSRSWSDINIDFSNNTVRHCCKAESEPIINSYNNNPKILQRRKDSLLNIRDNQCNYCWKEYDQYGSAFRDYWNEWKTLEDFNDDWVYLQIKFDNICNLSCIYCNEYDSSRIAYEKNIKIENYYNGSNKTKFYNWIEDQNFNDKLISILGGEPTISHNVIDFINFLSDKKHDNNLFLNINTNGFTQGKLRDKFFKLIESLPKNWKFTIVISNESTKSAPLIRYGLNTKLFWENFKLYVKSPSVTRIGLNPCLSKYSIRELSDYLESACKLISEYKKPFWIHGNSVENPKELCISSLPKDYVKYINNTRSVILSYNYLFKDNNIKQINNWLNACIDKIVNGEENYDSNKFLNELFKQKKDKNIFKLKMIS